MASDPAEGRPGMVPAPIPAELFELAYTVQVPGQPALIVYVCYVCGCFVPEQGRKMHRRWHEEMARMIRDAGEAS